MPASAFTNLGGSNNSSSSSWNKLERLRKIRKDFTVYDAGAYLVWAYLSYVQLHFQMKLMSRVVKLLLDDWKIERERARVRNETPSIKIATPLFLYCHHEALALIRDNGLVAANEDVDMIRSALAHFDFPQEYYAKL